MKNRHGKRKRRMKPTTYRNSVTVLNIVMLAVLVFFVVFGISHIFTKKKAYRQEGISAYNKLEYETAIKLFDQALECNQWFSDEIDVDIMLYQADAYMKLNDFTNANRIYLNLAKHYKNSDYFDYESISFMVDLTTALMQYQIGDFNTPLVTLKKAVDLGMTEMSLYVATCYEAQGNYDYMKQYFDIYSQKYGMDSYLYYKYASYYFEIDDIQTAASYVETGLTSDYKYQKDLRYLQILCFEEFLDYEKAFSLAKDFVEAYPDDEKGQEIYDFLDTRVHPNETVINDKFGLNEDLSVETSNISSFDGE